MRAAIYNQYLDTLGGGELYTLSFGKVLANLGYKVDLEWKDAAIIKLLEKRFGCDFSGINIVENINRGDDYDLCFWVSDGSIPTLKARNNFLHFQVPFINVGGSSLINKMKLFRFKKVICNSEFTKKFIDKEYGTKSTVIYPPVNVKKINAKIKKENIILYVGRFSKLMQSKNQDILIDAFKKLCRKKIGKWKLVLAGGTEVGTGTYINTLKKKAKGHPIEIIESPSVEKLRILYGRAKIFWSASGFGVDENKNPQKVEHFGVTAVEAMAGGAVPFCYDAGGHREIIKNEENGFLWKTEKDLINTTYDLIKDSLKLNRFSIEDVKISNKFSIENFTVAVTTLL